MMLLFIDDFVRVGIDALTLTLMSSWKSVILTIRRFFNGRSDPGDDILLLIMLLEVLLIAVLVLVLVSLLLLLLVVEEDDDDDEDDEYDAKRLLRLRI
jgi:hypothetical protein